MFIAHPSIDKINDTTKIVKVFKIDFLQVQFSIALIL